jgi:YbbR domain-containing protein
MTEETEESGSRVLSFLRAIFVRNFHLKSIALLLTLALYLWVGEDRETQVIATAPIQISVPEDQILLKPNIDKVKVTLRGRWSSLNRFDQEEMKPVVVTLSKSDDGELVPITPESVQIPPGLRVVSIEPSFIRVEMENRVDKEIDIKPRIVGHTRGSYEIGEVRVDPEKLTVSGPESVTATMESIPTEAIDVTGRVRTFKKRVQLRPDSRLISYELNSPVTVTVPIRAEEIQREIEKVTVHPVNTTYETAITPSKLDLTVRGPRSLVQNLDRSTLHAIVDLSREEEREPGTFEKKVEIRNLPADLEIVRMQPTHFLVTTKPRTSGEEDEGATEVETDDGG